MFPHWKRHLEKVSNLLESLDDSNSTADRELCLLDENRRVLEDVARERGITNPTNHNKDSLIKAILNTYK